MKKICLSLFLLTAILSLTLRTVYLWGYDKGWTTAYRLGAQAGSDRTYEKMQYEETAAGKTSEYKKGWTACMEQF